ncbi:class I SAM-dependent methyltransferase [Scytonema sp. NUACC26]|uniref:class I SAM-dependent methyltransferase n=1 Tax=Scytonema sp. NUACC26 TaxID=3140176 RepID=UPI0034DBF1EE
MLSPRTVLNTINNLLLRPLNLHLDTLTSEKFEIERLKDLDQKGHFESPGFNLPPGFFSNLSQKLLDDIKLYQHEFEKLVAPNLNQVKYTYNNNYFTSPDTEVLYTIIRTNNPETVMEIGCGNSTKIVRQAIIDGKLNTKLVSIDPSPRTEIVELVDNFYPKQLESLSEQEMNLFSSLKAGDILFIDSSHELKSGNDVVLLYTKIIPELKPGVLIHIHDIFLPYEYPRDWVVEQRWGWNEQYLVQCILTISNSFEVLWPGYFLQRSRSDFADHFSHLHNRLAQSLWLRKII